MTTDKNGQGLIDFSEVFTPRRQPAEKKGAGFIRKRVKPEQAVPAQKIKDLNTIRERCGYNCKEVADAAGVTNNFVYRALHGLQLINYEDYDKLLKGVAQLVFKKILEA